MKNYIIFGIIAVAIIAGAMLYKPTDKQAASIADTDPAAVSNTNTNNTSMGLKIEDVKVGTGAEAKPGSLISVHYVGTFADGKKFDSSRDRGEPFTFPLGQGMVIQGWEQGFNGMKVGGVRKLTVPPELGYGPNDYGPIPGGSTLYFEVELLNVREK